MAGYFMNGKDAPDKCEDVVNIVAPMMIKQG